MVFNCHAFVVNIFDSLFTYSRYLITMILTRHLVTHRLLIEHLITLTLGYVVLQQKTLLQKHLIIGTPNHIDTYLYALICTIFNGTTVCHTTLNRSGI